MSAEVKSVSIDVSKEEVLVESCLTSAEVQALIEHTGRRAVLKGIGGSEPGEEPQNATYMLLKCLYFCEYNIFSRITTHTLLYHQVERT